MFQAGQRVRALGVNPMTKAKIGDTGTIIGMFCNLPVVEFDRDIGGHDGSSTAKGKDGHCWLMEPHWVEVIKTSGIAKSDWRH
jgi:hypothetical protein